MGAVRARGAPAPRFPGSRAGRWGSPSGSRQITGNGQRKADDPSHVAGRRKEPGREASGGSPSASLRVSGRDRFAPAAAPRPNKFAMEVRSPTAAASAERRAPPCPTCFPGAVVSTWSRLPAPARPVPAGLTASALHPCAPPRARGGAQRRGRRRPAVRACPGAAPRPRSRRSVPSAAAGQLRARGGCAPHGRRGGAGPLRARCGAVGFGSARPRVCAHPRGGGPRLWEVARGGGGGGAGRGAGAAALPPRALGAAAAELVPAASRPSRDAELGRRASLACAWRTPNVPSSASRYTPIARRSRSAVRVRVARIRSARHRVPPPRRPRRSCRRRDAVSPRAAGRDAALRRAMEHRQLQGEPRLRRIPSHLTPPHPIPSLPAPGAAAAPPAGGTSRRSAAPKFLLLSLCLRPEPPPPRLLQPQARACFFFSVHIERLRNAQRTSECVGKGFGYLKRCFFKARCVFCVSKSDGSGKLCYSYSSFIKEWHLFFLGGGERGRR